jgi:hypothetical protein
MMNERRWESGTEMSGVAAQNEKKKKKKKKKKEKPNKNKQENKEKLGGDGEKGEGKAFSPSPERPHKAVEKTSLRRWLGFISLQSLSL